MGGRGFATAGLLVLIALACIAIAKRLESERRMVRELRELRTRGISIERLKASDHETFERLRRAGVFRMSGATGQIDPDALRAFKGKRTRFALTGALMALVLAILVAFVILR